MSPLRTEGSSSTRKTREPGGIDGCELLLAGSVKSKHAPAFGVFCGEPPPWASTIDRAIHQSHAEAVALRREELFKDSFLFGRQTNAKITHAHAHTSPTIG